MIHSSAHLSPDGLYRYDLWRVWEDDWPCVMFIGLNPSTADAMKDDPTIRRCIRFAKDWGYGGLCMTNLFAFRATSPRDMMAAEDPVGRRNNASILGCMTGVHRIIAAWGAHGSFRGRSAEVRALFDPDQLWCLGTTTKGEPRHPLYLRADTPPRLLEEI